MGMHVESGSADRAPAFFYNHCGYLPWSGKVLRDFTVDDAMQMREFVESEAYVDGYRTGREANRLPWNPFDEAFLFGEPYRLWAKCFAIGMAKASM